MGVSVEKSRQIKKSEVRKKVRSLPRVSALFLVHVVDGFDRPVSQLPSEWNEPLGPCCSASHSKCRHGTRRQILDVSANCFGDLFEGPSWVLSQNTDRLLLNSESRRFHGWKLKPFHSRCRQRLCMGAVKPFLQEPELSRDAILAGICVEQPRIGQDPRDSPRPFQQLLCITHLPINAKVPFQFVDCIEGLGEARSKCWQQDREGIDDRLAIDANINCTTHKVEEISGVVSGFHCCLSRELDCRRQITITRLAFDNGLRG